MTNPEKITLAGNEAIELWKKGKDAWNNWVDKNTIADVSFNGANFSKHVSNGTISFEKYKFPTGQVNFKEAKFGKGDVFFRETTFGKGHVGFIWAHLGEGNFEFCEVAIGECSVSFKNTIFEENVNFYGFKNWAKVTKFSLKNVSFAKTFSISGDFGCVVDMVGTKSSHHVDLSRLTCHLQRSGFIQKAINEEDAARLRRLKELAEQNKHHEAALGFHADEMRAKRWRETNFFASSLDILFSAVSNYDQSIWRPLVGLGVLIILSPFAADGSAKAGEIIVSWGIDKVALKTAIQNSLPFLPASRSKSSLLSTLHQLGAVIFIFLIGLGLRNRFRV